MPRNASAFEVVDKPRVTRAILAGSTIALGVALSLAATWNLYFCVVAQTQDVAFLAIGAVTLLGGLIWLLLPLRAPRLILRADSEGLKLCKEFPIPANAAYENLPWDRIGSIRLGQYGEGNGIEIEASSLRDGGTVKYSVPVMGFQNVALDFIRQIEEIRSGRSLRRTDMSNQSVQPTPTIGAADAG